MGQIRQEVWVKDYAAALHQNSPFLIGAKNDSQYIRGKTVHAPEAGSAQEVTTNYSTEIAANGGAYATGNQGMVDFTGQTLQGRNDIDNTYDVNSYETKPFVIPDMEEAQTNHAVRRAITSEKIGALTERVGLEALIAWSAPVDALANIIASTGADGAAPPPGGTGTRNKIALADIAEARAKIVGDKFVGGQNSMNIAVPAHMYADLLEMDQFTRADAYGKSNLPSGVIGRILGFNVYEIAWGLIVTATTGVVDAVAVRAGTATLTTDSGAALCWHSNAARQAQGAKVLYAANKDPQVYGDILSMQVLFGAAPSRSAGEGLALIGQG